MHIRKLLAGVTLTAAALSACGNGSVEQTPPANTPSSSVAVAPFDAKVSITDFDATCRQVKCWLPTQFTPKLVERESVSLYDTWPMDGDSVRVLCMTEGEIFLNQSAHPTTRWYGILVPADKASPEAASKGQPTAGGYKAYVGVSWLKSDGSHIAPAC